MRLLTIRISAVVVLTLLMTAAAVEQESKRDAAELGELMQTFYQHRAVNKVVPMLQKAMKLKLPAGPEASREPIVYFFARMAELHPELLRQYEGLFDKADTQQRELLIEVLRACGDAQTAQMFKTKLDGGKTGSNAEAIRAALVEGIPKKFDLSQPAITGSDLDVRWGEFFISGNPQDVGRIADAVNAPEVVRTRVEQWLNDPSSATNATEVAKRALRLIGLRIDVEARKVLNLDDTDLLLMDKENRMGKERFDALKAALPFELTANEYMRIAVKGSALWSLSSNAEQHPPVKKFLETIQNDPRPRVRLACLRALAVAEFAEENYRAAEAHAKEYLSQTSNRDVNRLRMEANYRLELEENSQLLKSANAVPIDTDASAKAHERWVTSLESARSMAVQAVIWDEKGQMAVRFDTLFEAPDRYDVMQTAWEGKNRQAVYDKWRYLGTEQFMNFGFWVSGVPDELRRAELNPALRGEGILTGLKGLKPNAGSRWTGDKQSVVLLEYSPARMRIFKTEVAPTSCRVWMNESDGRVLKTEVNYVTSDKKEQVPVRVTQVFGGMNADIVLERPTEVMDFSNAKKESKTGK